MGMKRREAVARQVTLQAWEESEAGWGIRPDGWTLHLDEEACKRYIENQWKTQKAYFDKELGPGITPGDYTRTSGDTRQVIVSEKVYQKLLKNADNNGIWGKGNSAPSRGEITIPDSRVSLQ